MREIQGHYIASSQVLTVSPHVMSNSTTLVGTPPLALVSPQSIFLIVSQPPAPGLSTLRSLLTPFDAPVQCHPI